MYCIGLTGTIASGKSLAIDYFKSQGIDTLNADVIARELTQNGSPALAEISRYFGKDFLTSNGDLNRRKLRSHIVAHPEDRQWLEQLLHPMIRQHIESAIAHCKSPYCVIEIPLLLDRTPYPYLNRVLLITSEPHQQIQRLMARDHCSETEAKALLAHQETNNHRAELADDIVLNTGSVDELNDKLDELHHNYLQERCRLG
jgi:dephospho-CoA kinase